MTLIEAAAICHAAIQLAANRLPRCEVCRAEMLDERQPCARCQDREDQDRAEKEK